MSKQLQMKLYNLESCPFCIKVRRKLADLGLQYAKIDVPPSYNLRTEVVRVSGQPLVPVLVDGEVVLDDEDQIIDYLDATYRRKEG